MTNDIQSIKNRFIIIRNKLNLSQIELANAINKDKTAVSKIENPKEIKRGPTPSILMALSEVFGVNRQYIETGQGPMFTNPSNAVVKGGILPPLLPYEQGKNTKFQDLGDGRMLMVIRKVPEQARMGYTTGWADPEFIETLDYHTLIVDKRHAGNYMAFEAVGDSMENYTSEEMAKESIPNGSTVTGREIQKHLWKSKFHNHKWPDFIVVLEDGIVIKRLTHHDVENGIITLSSLNPNKKVYPDRTYSLDSVRQIFNVINVYIER